MTPHRSHGRGTLVLKVRYRGVPRIERSTGTNDPKVAEQIRRMCDVLYDQGRLDLLEAMALPRGDARRLHPMLVFDRYKAGTLERLPRAEVLVPLAEQWEAWTAAAKVADSTTESRRKGWRGLRRHLHAAATLHDLPGALRDYRAACAAHPRTFNLARAAVMAFVRDVLGKRHALYAQVADVRVLARVGPRRQGRPFTVAGLRAHMAAMPSGMGMASWTMAVTGMGPKEYFRDGFTVQADRVLIHGQKREGRERVIPRAARIEAPSVSRETWRRAFKRVSPERQPYDLRRTFPALMLLAGIPANRRRAYMGHGARTMTELYEDAEVTQWLVEDAAALARVLGEPNPTLRLVGVA
jgi:hypothetical protein